MKISEKARTLLAEEYERHGKYPTYAQQAMTSDAEFTMCSLRAIERALAPAQQVPGGGWKLVPAEPTSEMLVAALKTNGVCPQYAAMLAAAPQPPVGEPIGYAFHNPDTGMEWSEDHPRRSGEVPDAGRCQRMTLTKFREKYGYGDHDTTRAAKPPVGGNPVKRWEPRNTIVGYDMEPRDDGSFVLYEEVTARDQQIELLKRRIAELEKANG